MKSKKGQLTLGEAPTVVLIVGLTFLVMATVALVGEKYQGAFPSGRSGTVTNEAFTISTAGTRVAYANACNFENFAVQEVRNSSTVLTTGNYSTTEDGKIKNLTSMVIYGSALTANYTYDYTGTECNVTTDLNTEISNNTSIAGIVLTISLVGIVLTVLIGVFLGIRAKRI